MHPTLFQIGPLTVHTYGLLMALGFVAGMQVAIHYGKKEEIAPARMIDLLLYIFLSALAGAKLLHVVVDFSYYGEDWRRLLSLYQVGGVYYGGLILAILVSLIYMRRAGMNFWKTADAVCMGLASGQILGRIGCFSAGCCWGRACSPYFPLAVTFRDPEAAKEVGTPLFAALHPVQLYEAGSLVVVLGLLALAYRNKRFDGQQLFLYLFLYSTLRFCVEFFRGDPRGSIFDGMLSTSQFISLLVFGVSITAFVLRRKSLKPQAMAVS